jgi:ABC-type transporter Mla subunit MlaD
MKRAMKLLARLYPSSWRERYGAEFEALLEDANPSAWHAIDVLWGALKMQLTGITISISGKTLKVAVVALGAILLLLGASFLSSTGLFHPKYQILMFVPEAEGLHVGAVVKLDGVPIGNVRTVEIADKSADANRSIELVLQIDKRFQNTIRGESSASLVRGGSRGDRYVSIQRAFSGPAIDPGGEVRALSVEQ